MTPETKEIAAPDAKDWIGSIGKQMYHLTTGERATLRRLTLTRSGEAVGVVTGLLFNAAVPESAWRHPDQFARWALLAHVAAVLSGTAGANPHGKGGDCALGRRLHEAGYSELRLMRLTSARGPALVDQIVRAARILAAQGAIPVDLSTLHALTSHDERRADEARLDLARAYYLAEHAKQKRSAAP